jgi:preflagellin peptidase FlaK
MAFNPLLIGAAAIGVTLVYASILDLRSRRVPVRTWYPMLLIGAPFTVWFYTSRFDESPSSAAALLILSVVFATAIFLFDYFNLIGGADARAIAYITLLLPTFPFTPLLGDTVPGFFPFPLLIHTCVIALLVVPIGLLFWNWRQGVDGPLAARLRGYPVTAAEITEGRAFGFLMEDLSVEGGVLRRRFFTLPESILMMFSGKRLYTRELRVEPERFTTQLGLIKCASPVWIAVGVLFIVPLTVGFFVTLVVGDTLFFLLSRILGV